MLKRSEYLVPIAIPARVRRDLREFNPNVVHISSPDIVGHRAVSWARRNKIAAVASVHTRFDTYLSYYGIQFLEPAARAIMRRLYHRCEVVMAPAEFDRGRSARAAHEPRHRHLGPRNRSRTVQSRAPGYGMAAIDRNRRRRAGDRLSWPGGHGKRARRLCRRNPCLRNVRPEAPCAGHRRRSGPPLVRRTAAGRHFHRAIDRTRPRPGPRQLRSALQPVDHRSVRQRHAGGDGLRACRCSPRRRAGRPASSATT